MGQNIRIDDTHYCAGKGLFANKELSKGESIVSFGGQFVINLNQRILSKTHTISPIQAMQIVLSELGIEYDSPPMIIDVKHPGA